MKKILSLALAALLLVSMIPTAMAANTNPASQGTTITATGTKSEVYTVTVPATMAPGQTGNVTASGSWPANKTLKVTCPSSVDLYNGDDKMSVGVTFAGLELSGDNVDPISATNAAITIATVDTSAFFGTWTGTLTYTVELVTKKVAVVGSATFTDGVTLSWQELQLEENGTKYGYEACYFSDTIIKTGGSFYDNDNLVSITLPSNIIVEETRNSLFYDCSALTSATVPDGAIDEWMFYGCDNLTNMNIGEDVTYIGSEAFCSSENLLTINYAGTMEQWNKIDKHANWNYEGPVTKVICSDGTISLVESNLITFTIDDTEYQAEAGMTWGEWVESEYNTVGAYLSSSNYIYKDVGTDHFYVETGITSVKASDIIDPSIDDYCWTKNFPIDEK